MARIAKIVIEISLNREFDYLIPTHLNSLIKVGSQVHVPFNGRDLRGFVVGLTNHSQYESQLKEIDGVEINGTLITCQDSTAAMPA